MIILFYSAFLSNNYERWLSKSADKKDCYSFLKTSWISKIGMSLAISKPIN